MINWLQSTPEYPGSHMHEKLEQNPRLLHEFGHEAEYLIFYMKDLITLDLISKSKSCVFNGLV